MGILKELTENWGLLEARKVYSLTVPMMVSGEEADNDPDAMDMSKLYKGNDPAIKKKLKAAYHSPSDKAGKLKAHMDRYAAKIGLKAKVMSLRGPSGGAPEVKFSGPLDAMSTFIRSYFDDFNEAEIQEVIDDMVAGK